MRAFWMCHNFEGSTKAASAGSSSGPILNIISRFYYKAHEVIILPMRGPNLYQSLSALSTAYYSLATIRKVMKDIFSSLKTIHECKVIHGDIKPEARAFG